MTNDKVLIWSCIAMMLLTTLVALRMVTARLREGKAKQLRQRDYATSRHMAAVLEDVQAADNYRNLFEAPVLFYLLCVLLLVTHQASAVFAALAWGFVASRYVHSYIHCTYNKVRHRFYAFLLSCAILVLMWLWFAVQLLITS